MSNPLELNTQLHYPIVMTGSTDAAGLNLSVNLSVGPQAIETDVVITSLNPFTVTIPDFTEAGIRWQVLAVHGVHTWGGTQSFLFEDLDGVFDVTVTATNEASQQKQKLIRIKTVPDGELPGDPTKLI